MEYNNTHTICMQLDEFLKCRIQLHINKIKYTFTQHLEQETGLTVLCIHGGSPLKGNYYLVS
jgi:hypothetical protein